MKKMLAVGMVRRGVLMVQHANLAHPSLTMLQISTPAISLTQEIPFPMTLGWMRDLQDQAVTMAAQMPIPDFLKET